jgi:hypothetical protein
MTDAGIACYNPPVDRLSVIEWAEIFLTSIKRSTLA